jgi:hypothetical protein
LSSSSGHGVSDTCLYEMFVITYKTKGHGNLESGGYTFLQIRLHGITTQKTAVNIFSTMKTLNLYHIVLEDSSVVLVEKP